MQIQFLMTNKKSEQSNEMNEKFSFKSKLLIFFILKSHNDFVLFEFIWHYNSHFLFLVEKINFFNIDCSCSICRMK